MQVLQVRVISGIVGFAVGATARWQLGGDVADFPFFFACFSLIVPSPASPLLSRILPYISFHQPNPLWHWQYGFVRLPEESGQERDRVKHRSFDAVLDLFYVQFGNFFNICRFIHRMGAVYLVRHASLSVFSLPGGMSNKRMPSLTATGCHASPKRRACATGIIRSSVC